MNARSLVNRLLEAEDIDWSHDPEDPDAPTSASVIKTISDREASGIVDKYACAMMRPGTWLYHKPTGKRAKVNGRCRLWKREPDRFELPMKYGLYEYFYIDAKNMGDWSTKPLPVPSKKSTPAAQSELKLE